MEIKELPQDVEHGCLLEIGIDANHAWLVRVQQELQTRVPQCSRWQTRRPMKSREKCKE